MVITQISVILDNVPGALSNVSEIWFVKKNDEGAEKVASLDIVSRIVKRYQG